ncbi:MAG: endonuclease/exonuclease/phosphatase family protein [Verrucomicrobia bacterium]|nr:MAG: endonuclease/exonuclease/phosphatase family protein [Verrucomicrobiota bacterium]
MAWTSATRMWRSVLKKPTSAKQLLRLSLLRWAGVACAAVLFGCVPLACRPRSSPVMAASAGPTIPRPAADEFSVMTYNLRLYGYEDRDGDGQAKNPKPDDERLAVLDVLAAARPDVLAVQEMGNHDFFDGFRSELKARGLDYPHAVYLHRGQHQANLALLSRFPITSQTLHTNDQYSMGSAKLKVLRGFLDATIQVTPTYSFRIMVAHLKSKVFNKFGQTEMRRNEARLLNNHVRAALKENPDLQLVVLGDLNDAPESAALHEAKGERTRCLEDVRPADPLGDVWTYYSALLDQYERIDYILVSHAMQANVVREKTLAVRHPQTLQGSDHRPVMAVFKTRNSAATKP